tara:strand:+ start:11402 stop:12208 length:807 start_codon:yes stop_codon:yes gene_type:complete
MRTIYIRRKEVLNHLPKEVRAGAKISIGSIYIGRQPLRGVEGKEAEKLLSQILDVPPGHEHWPKQEKDFWASMTVKVPFEGKELNIAVDEAGNPENAMDFITYKWCLKHRQVADSEAAMKSDGQKRFYIYDPQIDLLKKNTKVKLQKEADKEFIKISSDLNKMRRLLRVLSKGAKPESLTDMEVENQLYDIKNTKATLFLKMSTDKNLDVRAELEEMVEIGVLRTIGNQLIYVDETIGENMTDAIVYFNNKKNSGQVNAMRAQLKELQ